MPWKQVKTPNLDPVVYQGGAALASWLGWCLAYVQTAFGAGWAGPTAWASWSSHTKKRHYDRNLPKGVYVLIWFDGYWNGQRLGHVAIYKDGKIWSSPISNKPFADVWTSIEQVEKNYGMRYVGWSEDVAGTAVIRYEAPTSTSKGGTMDEADLTAIYTRGPLALGGYRPRARKAKEGSDVYLGKSAAFVINDHYNSKEAKDKRAALAREFKGLEDEVVKLKKQAPVTVKTDADKKLQALKKAFEDAGII